MRCRPFSNVKIGDISCRTKVLRQVGARAGLAVPEEVPEELIVPFSVNRGAPLLYREKAEDVNDDGAISAFPSRIIFLSPNDICCK